MDRELLRQFFHLFLGLFAIFCLHFFGRGVMIAGVFFTLLIGLILVNFRILGKKLFFVEWFVLRFERENIRFPGMGSAFYVTGLLILLTFISNIQNIYAAILIFAVGDSFSTIIGRNGKIPLPYNKSKSLEGSLAFFLFSLSSWFFIGPISILFSLIATIVESIPHIDDNLSIPLVLGLLLAIL